MNDPGLDDLLRRLPGKRLLVVGDVMLDEYITGSVRRISPEAPVPVVERHKHTALPGGAANTAANAAGLRAEVFLAGVLGDDEPGKRLLSALTALGIGTAGLLTDASRPTTSKTRIVAQSQQVVRIDHEDRSPLSAELHERLIRLIDEQLPWCDACILSDYAKGVVSAALAQHLIRSAAVLHRPVVVDPKGTDALRYRGATLVKPNLHEAGVLLRREVSSPQDVLEAGRQLLTWLGGASVLITQGAAGMSLFAPNADPVHIAADAREVFDVTGAGDTVAATLAVALAAGASTHQAARLASRAAGHIVSRLGTAAISLDELSATRVAANGLINPRTLLSH